MHSESYNRSERIRELYTDEDQYIREHLQDIERLKSLIDTMTDEKDKNQGNLSPQVLKEKISSLEKFLKRHNLSLTGRETADLNVLISSSQPLPVLQKMLDDLLHSIRLRAARIIENIHEKDAIAKDIHDLEEPGPGLRSWFAITLFALQYGTLTTFTHKIKAQGIAVITRMLPSWLNSMCAIIEPVLGKEYYAFTPAEYNALALILDLRDRVEKLSSIPRVEIYETGDIEKVAFEVAKIFAVIIKNSSLIERAFARIEKSRKLPHGARGTLMHILDRPLKGNIPMPINHEFRTRETVSGALSTIFTAREGVLVKNMNQILYLTGINSDIDTTRKNLTPSAVKEEELHRNRMNSDKAILEMKRDYLVRVLDEYYRRAGVLSDKLLRAMSRNSYEAWKNEHLTHPLLRIRRIVGGIIQFFTEPLCTEKMIVPVYEAREFPAYFTARAELIKASASFNELDKNIAGSREKDITAITVQNSENWEESLTALLTPTARQSTDSSRLVREVLIQIASRSYDLALRTSEIADGYYRRKTLSEDSVEDGYSFFSEAVLKNTAGLRCRVILGPGEITLKDFIEAMSALAFLVAKELQHPGIEAIRKDRAELEIRLSEHDEARPKEVVPGEEEEQQVLTELDALYRDSVTGLWRKGYLEDQIIPRFYDELHRYRMNTQRHIFMTSLEGLPDINKLKGHDTGDRIFRMIADHFKRFVLYPGADLSDVILRWEGNVIMGFINGVPRSSAVDLLKNIHDSISEIQMDDIPSGMLSFSTGIYTEHFGISIDDSLAVTHSLMIHAINSGDNKIAVLRNPEQTATRRNIDQHGELSTSMITVL